MFSGGERLSDLLFITCEPFLTKNIGEDGYRQMAQFINGISSSTLLNLPANKNIDSLLPFVRTALKNKQYKGVVIIGGFDVIPSLKLRVIDALLQQKISAMGFENYDADDFIVWSDDVYGDAIGDLLPELPVSRIPDGKDATLVMTSLTAPKIDSNQKFGVRNIARPFADASYCYVPGTDLEVMEVSESFGPGKPIPDSSSGFVYFMLHGSDTDSTKFWGERSGGGSYEAIRLDEIPHNKPGSIVFTGCCWGALSSDQPACRKRPEDQVQGKIAAQSIALAYLKAGALAFVGCTGSHYSPVKAPYNYFGKPMHDSFWKGVSAGLPPAKALFEAKKQYIKDLPHGQTDAFSQAVELKILRQYTCLGLGW